ncbi:MAG TPA: hypothetical protein PLS90_01680 [Candidatus Sumerlaeota bacterium]|nr:MAG: hypothetical protein BWZ08_02183 [candidate division BRC1 bacterium ADurb.BinA292]HPK01144.1 hypothetical protein [Candidatus Sumerlaeota bacterium]
MIRSNHPLRVVFRRALGFGFDYAGIRDSDMARYLEENVMVEFIHVDRIHRFRRADGRPVEAIADMLVALRESEQARAIPERDRHKYIGDYTLFMTGLFPELLGQIRGDSTDHIVGSLIMSGDVFAWYVAEGRRSYGIAARFGERIFDELARNYVSYADALRLARNYLDTLKDRSLEGFTDGALAS